MTTRLTRDTAKPFLERRFAEHNARHFDATLVLPPIVFFDRFRDPDTQQEKFAAFFGGPQFGTSGVAMFMFTDEAVAEGEDFLSDTLLHEMIHYAQTFLDGDAEPQKHGAPFVAIANRIATALGLGHVERESDGATCWPQSLRK